MADDQRDLSHQQVVDIVLDRINAVDRAQRDDMERVHKRISEIKSAAQEIREETGKQSLRLAHIEREQDRAHRERAALGHRISRVSRDMMGRLRKLEIPMDGAKAIGWFAGAVLAVLASLVGIGYTALQIFRHFRG